MIFQRIKQWFYQKQLLFYIGRHDVLKEPLRGKEEEEALKRLQQGDLKARDLLIEHNLRLVVYVAKKYDSLPNGNIEDLISIGTIGLVKAVLAEVESEIVKCTGRQEFVAICDKLKRREPCERN